MSDDLLFQQTTASIQGRGLIGMKIAPASADRAIALATQLLGLAGARGYARDTRFSDPNLSDEEAAAAS
jgi:hypothetical protein